ncbi:hypothetical protein Salat_1576300 [Sesamum alatum]|uniref:Uncharacterized protein n=1 Tax=Sesamum alatum TaxID=300844 RepID=A0AAE2CMX4_9LAMI|nr:hypothetical protein Salat_1576300 [Sesamum alatum]
MRVDPRPHCPGEDGDGDGDGADDDFSDEVETGEVAVSCLNMLHFPMLMNKKLTRFERGALINRTTKFAIVKTSWGGREDNALCDAFEYTYRFIWRKNATERTNTEALLESRRSLADIDQHQHHDQNYG